MDKYMDWNVLEHIIAHDNLLRILRTEKYYLYSN